MERNSFKEQGVPCILCCVLAAQLCSDSLGSHRLWSPPGSSVHGTVQARILEWVASPFSRGSSRPRDQTRSPVLQADYLPSEPPQKH